MLCNTTSSPIQVCVSAFSSLPAALNLHGMMWPAPIAAKPLVNIACSLSLPTSFIVRVAFQYTQQPRVKARGRRAALVLCYCQANAYNIRAVILCAKLLTGRAVNLGPFVPQPVCPSDRRIISRGGIGFPECNMWAEHQGPH